MQQIHLSHVSVESDCLFAERTASVRVPNHSGGENGALCARCPNRIGDGMYTTPHLLSRVGGDCIVHGVLHHQNHASVEI